MRNKTGSEKRRRGYIRPVGAGFGVKSDKGDLPTHDNKDVDLYIFSGEILF